jgi:hypothetical protein
MNHALIYHGAFELNFDKLGFGATQYLATDGSTRPLAPTPASVDGLVVGYMERSGKKFSAVRLRFENQDIVLRNAVPLDPMRHLGSRRFTARPIVLDDALVSALLDDVLAQNPEQQSELALLINRMNQVRRGDRPTIE